MGFSFRGLFSRRGSKKGKVKVEGVVVDNAKKDGEGGGRAGTVGTIRSPGVFSRER